MRIEISCSTLETTMKFISFIRIHSFLQAPVGLVLVLHVLVSSSACVTYYY
jgi:hypothetical protein